jgi:hypothetical protein
MGCCGLAWEGNTVLEDWCTSNCLGIQGWIVCRRVNIFIRQDEFLTGYIGKLNACDSTSMLKLLHDYFEGLGKILEGGLGKAFGFVLKVSLHLVLLAKHDNVLLCKRVKVDFARHTLEVLHREYPQFEAFLCKVGDGMATHSPAS